MCTFRHRGGEDQGGFSLIELVVGLALAAGLAVAASCVWLSLATAGANEGDLTVKSLQGRVAVARFERDLRLTSADGCPFVSTAAVLEASASQVVFLQRSGLGRAAPVLVEWEIVGATLMRRWGACPSARPSHYAHSSYRDSKTMLEGVRSGGAFDYLVKGAVVPGPLSESDLASVEAVVLHVEMGQRGGRGSAAVTTTGRVGR